MTTATKLPECRIEILDAVNGTRREFVLPCSVQEAQTSCVEVTRALGHAEELDCLDRYPTLDALNDGDRDLAVTVQTMANAIKIAWWASGEPTAAARRLAEIMEGHHHER